MPDTGSFAIDRPPGSDPGRRYPPVRLVADGLVVDRGGRRVLDGASLVVESGECVLLTGPNGVGKSTLIRTLFGVVPRDRGTVTLALDGTPVEDVPAHCHYLGHRDALKTALTVAENLAFWRDFLGDSDGLAIEAALAAVDLADLADLPAAYLSAGQRRRLAIARLVAVRRPIWLLDEPTAALDSASEQRLIVLMGRHLADGGAILAATHLAIDLVGCREVRLAAAPVAADAEAFA